MANLEELIENLAQDARAVKPAPSPLLLAPGLLLGALAYLALCLWFTGVRPDAWHAFHQPWLLAEIALLFLILLSSTLSAAILSFPDLYQMRTLARAPALLFGLFAALLYFAWRTHPAAPLPEHSYQCTLCITLVSIPPAVWTLLVMRRYACTHFRAAGGIALMSAFSIGALWLRLHEVNDSIVHVLQWHYLPMLMVGLLGLCLGKRLLKW